MSEPQPSHYFDASPGARSRPRTVNLTLPDLALQLQTDTGVFSAEAIDLGSLELLRADIPVPQRGVLLDLGCGYGPIALTLASRAPDTDVWAVDVNERARELCTRNARASGLDNVRVAATDEVPDEVRFTGIWSNPPIRVGKAALHELLLRWLPRLEPDAHAYLVVQKHLGADSLQRWLTTQGYPTERVASRKGYRILDVSVREPDR